jgi:hypothetical protein
VIASHEHWLIQVMLNYSGILAFGHDRMMTMPVLKNENSSKKAIESNTTTSKDRKKQEKIKLPKKEQLIYDVQELKK